MAAARTPRGTAVPARGGSRPRLWPEPACSPPGWLPPWQGSQAFPHAGRQDVELVAVLGHRAPGDFHAALLELLHNFLVRQRILGILVVHELLDLRLDGARAGVFACRGLQAAREKELERQQPAR